MHGQDQPPPTTHPGRDVCGMCELLGEWTHGEYEDDGPSAARAAGFILIAVFMGMAGPLVAWLFS